MAIAYKVPLPENYRAEFDNLDLRRTQQSRIECPHGCGTTYALIYNPAEVDAVMLDYYRQQVEIAIGACNGHPGKIALNF